MREVLHSNLESFLSLTTPTVLPLSVPKACLWDLNASDWTSFGKDKIQYFNLGDLWDCYDEWSAYGVGAPIVSRGEQVVQYYTPYLSAIQIYTSTTKDNFGRHVNYDCDGEFEINSWTSESESMKLSRSSSSSSDKIWDMEDINISLDDQWLSKDKRGDLYFEYFEADGPFRRIPLKNKIDMLSWEYPGLKEFNSNDLSPFSWMSIAWYPIYHIPASMNAKELYAAFLTYHTFSLSCQDNTMEVNMGSDIGTAKSEKKEATCKAERNSISLAPFGLATYRMQRTTWLNPEGFSKLSVLRKAADSWLKQLQVHHHDFNFFTSHTRSADGLTDFASP